jgi:hypothetical protein
MRKFFLLWFSLHCCAKCTKIDEFEIKMKKKNAVVLTRSTIQIYAWTNRIQTKPLTNTGLQG